MQKLWLSIVLGLLLTLPGCEQDINLDLPAGKEVLVVEGHIDQNQPPVIMLTRSNPVFAGNTIADIEDDFVHQAQVIVGVGNEQYTLQEYTNANLTPALREIIAEQFSLNLSQLAPGAKPALYFYIAPSLKGIAGENYKLTITAGEKTLTAITSIPHMAPVEMLWTVPHPDPKNESLVTLWYRYRDPDTLGNCIRYFTKRNRQAFYAGYLNSVFIDEFVNGKTINFPLERGQPKSDIITGDKSYSYFRKGDTISLKWSSIDIMHYQFWASLEAERSSNGNPVASPVAIQGNINGGLGIWGGYGSTYYKIIVPK